MALDLGAIGSKLLWPNGLYILILSMEIIKQEQLPKFSNLPLLKQSGAEG